MARRRKLTTTPQVGGSPRKYRGPKSNGLPESNVNSDLELDESVEEEDLKPGHSFQEPKSTVMSPSTTVVHKKFGKISCLPPENSECDQNMDSEGSNQDIVDSNAEDDHTMTVADEGAELLEVVLAQEQDASAEDCDEMDDTETFVVEVDENMVGEIDHQNTVIVQVVGDELVYSDEDGATIWEVEAVEEVDNDNDGSVQETEDGIVQEEIVMAESENVEDFEHLESSEDLAVNNVTSSGIMEKCDGLDVDVSSSRDGRDTNMLDSDVSDREVDEEHVALRDTLSPDEITQMVLGLNCGNVNVDIEQQICEKGKDERDSASNKQVRESVITRRNSDVDMDVETNSRLKGNPIHVYGNTKKNRASLPKGTESSVIQTNCETTPPPRRNVICIEDSPLKSPLSGGSTAAIKKDDFGSCNELPISSIGGSLHNVDLDSVIGKKALKVSDSLGIEALNKKPKPIDSEMDVRKATLVRNRSGSSDTAGSDSGSRSPTVRRSSRIRTPITLKRATSVKTQSDSTDSNSENPCSSSIVSPVRPISSNPTVVADVCMPVKVKSRWRRSSELEMGGIASAEHDIGSTVPSPSQPPDPPPLSSPSNRVLTEKELKVKREQEQQELAERLKGYEILKENLYLTDRIRSKEAKRMVCDCTLSKDEIARGEMGCGEDCLNRLLMIECGSRCPVKNMCSNKRFQTYEYAKCEVFKTVKKGFGLRTMEDLPGGNFIMEYVGEVLDPKEFRKRAKEYSKDQNKHYYFMALKSDAIIDATTKGNHSRFINHSCEPNAETQKWTVNGELRIGFFTTKLIRAGEEITFDYQFQRYGKDAQRCYCESSICRGWIGGDPDSEKSRSQWQEWKCKDSSSRRKRDKDKDKRREDIDLEEEIEKLCSTGLKSKAHTLTLCRLMVRADDMHSRAKLLRFLRDGEPACCRLFLDYHGLRLIWSWMIDTKTAENIEAKSEILRTLKKLPIPNKTMLMDSKVWGVVERWSVFKSSVEPSPPDSNNRPFEEESSNELLEKVEADDKKSYIPVDEKLPQIPDISSLANQIDCKPSLDHDGDDESKKSTLVSDADAKTCAELAAAILEEWCTLKEVFRIPKKERIEQMKEHEREADQYSGELDERYREGDRSSYDRYDRYREDRRKRSRESPDHDRSRRPRLEERSRYDDRRHEDRSRYLDRPRYEERKFEERPRILEEIPRADVDVKLSKEARRRAFALKVQQEEEEREARRVQAEKAAEVQRQAHEDWWRYHEERCRQLNLDPHVTAAIFNSQYYDPATNQWAAYTHPQDPNLPPSSYHSDVGQASVLFGSDPNSPVASQIQGTTYSSIYQTAPSQPSPYEANPLLPGVSPVPNGVSPGILVGMVHSAGSSADTPVVVPQLGTVDPQPSVFQGPEDSFRTQETVQQGYSVSGGPVETQEPVTQYIAPPVPIKLPPKWKSAKDAEGRTYYYHVKTRVSQWEPPQLPVSVQEAVESESSSTSSDDENDNEDENENEEEESESSEAEEKQDEEEEEEEEDESEMPLVVEQGLGMAAHHQQLMLADPDYPNFSPRPRGLEARKKRRVGLVQEHIISPRREEERTDPKVYKQIKDKLRRQKEKRRQRDRDGKSSKKRHRDSEKLKTVYSLEKPVTVAADTSSDAARRIKDQFRLNMAGVIVQHLNPYRKPDCRMGRITNTEDFKHLARKLTHFVMLKELKHCRNVDDLECNDNVKHKARDFIKKYMAKFGEVYLRPKDDD